MYNFCTCSNADNSSVKRNTKTPSHNKTRATNKCMIPLEPLVFNGNIGTPVKRRASRSVPDESSITPKKSKGNQSVKKAKEPIISPRQKYGMYVDMLINRIHNLGHYAVLLMK